jgi:dephospho-CoA kinase
MLKREGPVKIGVTGGIGAGKSTVCKILADLAIPVYNADNRARYLMEENPGVISLIRESFSDQAYSEGKLNREYLASEIFSNDEQLRKMNGIVHPAVNRDFDEWVKINSGSEIIIKEAALLFETGSYKNLDKVILVYCPLETRINRVILRDLNRTRRDIEKIIEKQLSDTAKKKLADFVITNDDRTPVLPQLFHILEQCKKP